MTTLPAALAAVLPVVLAGAAGWLAGAREEARLDARILLHTRTGHPCGTAGFISQLEAQTGRILHPLKRGPKPRRRD